MRRVKAALAAGADVNGCPELPCTPIVAATGTNNADMVAFLIKRGADPDRPANSEHAYTGLDVRVMPGELALHIAAKQGNVDITRLLLKKLTRANPNATDTVGFTPLMTACSTINSHPCVAAVVRLLLEVGADPTLTEQCGHTALHMAVHNDVVDVIDMLLAEAPATLSSYAAGGKTPLFTACNKGNETMVSRLISLGAIQQMVPDENSFLPAAAAATNGFVGVVRLLIKEGIEAVGNEEMFHHVLYAAVYSHHARILQLLLAVGGEEMRPHWANAEMDDNRLLHNAAGECCPASVSVLLAAGADEGLDDAEGRLPRDVIGVNLGQEVQMDRGKEVGIRRMLERGPAFRARSWAWPTEEAGAGGCIDGDAVPSSAPAPKAPLSLRICRPKSDTKFFFARLVGRYCEKD